ncbi:MAG: alanine--tRNA ligase [Pirellulales bacterium]
MKTDELREKYLEFFVSKGHKRVASDVLVPTWDPSVLFTPAGMNQFKDHFLGKVKLEFTRATTCQKCLRTGDIDNVGRTAYHHTFFEMLGNFSFGDYFKREAIQWAWEFLTSPKWMNLPGERLTVSVYTDDDEAAAIWNEEIGLPSNRIVRMGEDDNFWPAGSPTQGPDGVCGPCSEIFYHPPGGGKEVEIWNLVFTQFNRVGAPPNNLRPLPSRNIDTGMGLERIASVLQGVETNFHIDILKPIVEAAAEACGVKYDPKSDSGRRLRRITDHVRACTMAVHENVYPGPNKEKYVVRRLLRRAVLDGHQLGLRDPFLFQLVPVVVDMMKGPYPELLESPERVASVIRKEEESTFATIDSGLPRVQRILDELQESGVTLVDGKQAAHIYGTYGFPPELFETLATERQMTFDWDGFHAALKVDSAEGHLLFAEGPIEQLKKTLQETQFVGYETDSCSCEIKGLVADNRLNAELSADADREVIVALDKTPFYGESGGQVGDHGTLKTSTGQFEVRDTQKAGGVFLHYGRIVQGKLSVGSQAEAAVNTTRREAIKRAHSATHILHHALQKSLGSHAQQQGSKVDDDWLRFDFTNLAPVDPHQLEAIQSDVESKIGSAQPIQWTTLPLSEARTKGAMMLFGEKYPDPVRMVSMGEFSRELCGGTHLRNTREVGSFEILSEEGVSAGTRRVVAVTGQRAADLRHQTEQAARTAAILLGCEIRDLESAARQLNERVKDLKKQLAGSSPKTEKLSRGSVANPVPAPYDDVRRQVKLVSRLLNVPAADVPQRLQQLWDETLHTEQQLAQRAQAGGLSADQLISTAIEVGEAKTIVAEIPLAGPDLMRQLIDQIRRKTPRSAVLLASSSEDGKVTLVAGVSRELIDQGVNAGSWVREVATIVGGSGGGKPDMAQAGGKDPQQLPAALAKARSWINAQLSG